MRIFCCAVLMIVFCTANNTLSAQVSVAEMPATLKPVPRDGWWIKRHEAMNARVDKGNVDLIFIGDSITQAWEGAGKNVWKKHYESRNAVNLGISGDRTQHVLWRLENGNIDDISPKLAVIMIGTNNANDDEPANTAAGIIEIVRKLRADLPETKILLLAVFPRGPNLEDRLREKNTEVNKIISRLDDGEMIHYLDIADAFLDSQGNLSKEVMPDLLHLNPPSYQKWADAIEPSVKSLMGE